MDLITDASSIINLDNANALEIVARLEGVRLFLSPLVIGECQPTCAARLLELQQQGLIYFVDQEDVSAEQFLTLLEVHELGEGETECLAFALDNDHVFCCDDQKARRVATEAIGADRIIGSLRLLKWAVEQGLLGAQEAYAKYEEMKRAGGFLPTLTIEWFQGD